MSDEEKFDVIIIGAGPAGSACAYLLAREGKNVLVIERGDSPGSKNVTGGRLYTYALDFLEPGLYKEAALERKVVREQMMFLAEKTAVTIDYFADNKDIPPSFTVLRANFDQWLADKAEEQGAMIACGIKVDDLIIKDDVVVGVKAGEDEMYADVVIGADGVNSFMGQKAGLKKEWTVAELGVGVKEIIELSEEKISNRFAVGKGEGAARTILGQTERVQGGGFIYTNKDTISVGLVLNPGALAKQKQSIADIFQEFKMHPAIYPLIEGGTTAEYSAHLVSENGWNSIPKKLYRQGFLLVGDAAGFCINTGTMIRGIDLAIVSGVAAAKAILSNNGKEIGPLYVQNLQDMELLPTMKLFAGWPEITAMPRMAKEYPDMINEMMQYMFKVDGKKPEKMTKAMRAIMKKHVSISQLVTDVWKGYRAV